VTVVDVHDREKLAAFLARHNADRVARRGELVDATARPAFGVLDTAGTLIGVLTYDIVGDQCEVLTLHVDGQWAGTGTALVAAVGLRAAAAGCRRLWVVTTNDNVDGLRFYQRRGFRIAAVRPGAVDEARRTLKPQIPSTGFYGIPLLDEIELAQDLTPGAAAAPGAAAPASTPRTS
jgi:N-acetylglutamate synthase-like GNAT family acetyltransferase